jgi:hypothetical protein
MFLPQADGVWYNKPAYPVSGDYGGSTSYSAWPD